MKRKILIIDDEKDFIKIVKLNLEDTGKYEVQTEHRGERGLCAVREFKPDLILLDLVMPGIDGSIVAQHIKEDEDVKHIPIVFLTALIKKELNCKNNVISGHRFISKPVNIQELIDCIEETVCKRY